MPPASPGPAALPGRSALGSPGAPQARRGKAKARAGCGAAVRRTATPGQRGDRPGRWLRGSCRREAGGLSAAWQESPPVCRPRVWFVGFFSFFWGVAVVVVFSKLRDLRARRPTTPANLLRPGQQVSRGASGRRRAPSPAVRRARQRRHRSGRGGSAGGGGAAACSPAPPAKPSCSSPHSCRAHARCPERGRLSLPPLPPAPRVFTRAR